MTAAKDLKALLGRAPERLTLEERHQALGKTIALEIYRPDTLPLRRIEAIGESIEECIAQLKSRGLDPTAFEFTRLAPPY